MAELDLVPPGAAEGANEDATESRLNTLKSLLHKGLISEADYEAKKQEILSDL